jgi:hypothetical protein
MCHIIQSFHWDFTCVYCFEQSFSISTSQYRSNPVHGTYRSTRREAPCPYRPARMVQLSEWLQNRSGLISSVVGIGLRQ